MKNENQRAQPESYVQAKPNSAAPSVKQLADKVIRKYEAKYSGKKRKNDVNLSWIKQPQRRRRSA